MLDLPRALRPLLALALAASLGLGVAKVLRERTHPPAFASAPANRFEGYVAIDGYGQRSDLFRRWIHGEEGAGAALTEDLQSPMHPTTVVVPALVGLVAPDAAAVPRAFLALSVLATLLQVAAVARLARLLAPESPAATWTAAVLVAGHCLTARTAGHLYVDPFCALFGTWAWLASLRWAREPGAGRALAVAVPLALGTFTKVSFLPWLAAPAIALVALGERRRLAAGVLLGAVPVALAAVYLAAVPGLAAGTADSRHLLGATSLSPRRLLDFAVEMALLVQLAPLVLWRGGPARGAAARGTAAMLALVLVATWAFRLPSVPRLYLPALGLGAALTATALLRAAPPRRVPRILGVYVAANAAAAALVAFVL